MATSLSVAPHSTAVFALARSAELCQTCAGQIRQTRSSANKSQSAVVRVPFKELPSRLTSLHAGSRTALYRTQQCRPFSVTYASSSSEQATLDEEDEEDVEDLGIAPPFNVLITGSTKGIGLALARGFLEAGDNVVICARNAEKVAEVVSQLSKEFIASKVRGIKCDVSKPADVERLAAFAKRELGHIDMWINNAASNAYKSMTLLEFEGQEILDVVGTNTAGVLLCCREAIKLMRDQTSGGHIFNMDGAGADGGPTPRLAAYGATKRSLEQLTKSLQAELKILGINKVTVHNLSPGMVVTDLLMCGSNTKVAKFFINILAEPPETVANFLVPRVRQVPLANNGSSTYIRYLTNYKAYSQILARLFLGQRRNRYLEEDGYLPL